MEVNNSVTSLKLTGSAQDISAGSHIPLTVHISTLDGQVCLALPVGSCCASDELEHPADEVHWQV